MLRNRILIRSFAVFFIIEILANAVWPTVSYALTSGPTAPEATSFEPVDTTDMVNVATGDFVYNLPLLEVPGPSGGFPLSLSYHAGIMTDEEASWVGLGWTLNPGAINRSVNGYADDHKNAEQTTRFYWDGGEQHEARIGVSIGIAGSGSVSAGISVGHDTFQGFGVGMFLSVGVGLGKNGPLGLSAGMEVDPWGNPSMSAGLGISSNQTASQAIQLSGGLNISTNFKSVSASVSGGASVSYGKTGTGLQKGGASLLGASMSTNGTKLSSSVGIGGASVQNSKSGKMSVTSYGFTLPLPFLHLGYRYTRYWIDEMERVKTNGILYNPSSSKPLKHFVDTAYDSYSLASNGTLAYREDPSTTVQGTLPGYDNYTVTAQGVAGSFKPHLLRGHMYRQNIRHYDDNKYVTDVIHLPTEKTFANTPVNFRFVNDFSNRYQYTPDSFITNSNNKHDVPLSFEFSTAPVTGDLGTNGMANNHLVGSKYIRHFINSEIKNGVGGFIETKTSGFDRQATPNDQLGGFQIVNESGVTYHFSLPAYSREEFQYSEDKSDVTTFNYSYKPEKYAYTWYLTAVTGPDYVDRGPAGPSEEDWGYWVELEYGKWSDCYAWRNPGEASQRDIDTKFRNFSEGLKEVYYLDAIRTKTHTALFVKNIRPDAKSAIRILKNITKNVVNVNDIKYGAVSANKAGGYIPKNITNTTSLMVGIPSVVGTTQYISKPVSSLKLEKVILMNNKDLQLQGLSKTAGNDFHQSMKFSHLELHDDPFPDEETHEVIQQHLPDNVLDIADVNSSLIAKALRVIQFNTDNSTLCPETANSFSHASLSGAATPSTNANDYELAGKLALKSIQFLGKEGADLMPPTNFSYDLSNPVSGSGTLSVINSTSTGYKRYALTSSSTLNLGDIIRFTSGGKTCYASVYRVTSGYRVQIIGRNQPEMGAINWVTTKNPPYNKNNSDEWGMYKGDYFDVHNDHIDKLRTNVSKNQVDVWSLREIQTSTGAIISMKYESDTYQEAVLSRSYPLVISKTLGMDFSQAASNLTTITIDADVDAADYFFDVGDYVSMLMIYEEETHTWTGSQCDFWGYVTHDVTLIGGTVAHINANKITVNSMCLTNFFTKKAWETDAGYESCMEQSSSGGGSGGGSGEPQILMSQSGEVETLTALPPTDEEGGTLPSGCPRGWKKRYFHSGNVLIYKPDIDIPGGDLRTVSVTVEEPFTGSSKQTNYSYTDVEHPSHNSGVTSYTPGVLDKYELPNDVDENSITAKMFRQVLYNSYSELISKASEVPPPGVMYKYVTVRESVKNQNENTYTSLPNYSTYKFRVFDYKTIVHESSNLYVGNLITRLEMESQTGYNFNFNENESIKKIKIKDYTTRIGEVESITVYNNDGNKVSETINHYLHDELTTQQFETQLESQFKNQGRVDETFIDARAVRRSNGFSLLAAITQRQRFPSIQTGQTTINYKNGIQTTSKNIAFDFYSGQVTKTLSTDGYGNTYISETTPAYRIYPAMGVAAKGGYNMLTQEARTSAYKVDPADYSVKLGLVSSNTQTWSGEVPILDHPELLSSITLSSVYPKNSAGYYPARSSGLTNYLLNGDRVRFVRSGYTYLANVVSSVKNIPFSRYDYELQLIENPAEITSTVSNLSAQRLTVPRKHSSYTYIGDDAIALRSDGLHTITDNEVPPFNAWNKGDATPVNWQKNSEITLYDVQSHALEAKDMNGQFAATKMSRDQAQVYATVANAEYREFAYSGGEDKIASSEMVGGNVKINGSVSPAAHTGHAGISATAGNRAFSYLMNNPKLRTYNVNVWATQEDIVVKYKPGTQPETSAQIRKVGRAGSWYQFEAIIPVTSALSELEIWCEAKNVTTAFDDFRVHPADASMVSYVYNQWGELSHILDNNNLYTEYRYDGMGRLKETFRETFMHDFPHAYGNQGIVKVGKVDYNYGSSNSPYMITISSSKSGSSGSITPSASVKQGGAAVFEVKETCSTYSFFQRIKIDNKPVLSTQTEMTLFDGTKVQVNGKIITFENIQSPHTISAEFASPPLGFVRCHSTTVNGVTCYDGTYRYGYYNSCWQEGTTYSASSISQVPANLQQYVPSAPCCPGGQGVALNQGEQPGQEATQVALPQPNECPCSSTN